MKIGIAREMPRHPLEPQLSELRALGCDRVLTVGPDWSSWVAAMEHLRKGDSVMFRYLHLLPPPRLSTADSRRRFLFRCLRDLCQRGSPWVETSSGRRSTDDAEKLAAIEDAVEYITFQANSRARSIARKNGAKGGAPKAEFSLEERRRAFDVYTDLRLAGDELKAALKSLGWSTARCYREWGGRTRAVWKDTKP